MTKNNIHIGILGGMGPQASALLHTKIIAACTQQLGMAECDEFPMITHVSIPAIDFISNPELRHKNTELLANALKALTANPLDIAVIACNTAHLLIDEVPGLAALPLISLPESVAQEAQRQGVQKLGLIASPTTLKMKLYEHASESYGVEVIQVSFEEAKTAEEAIRNTIAGKNGSAEIATLDRLATKLEVQGAEKTALGCTELSVIMARDTSERYIDSLTAATKAVVRRIEQLHTA